MPAPDQNFRLKRIIDFALPTGDAATYWTETVPSGRSWEILSWIVDEHGTGGILRLDMSSDGLLWHEIEDWTSDIDHLTTVHLQEGDQLKLSIGGSTSGTWDSLINYKEYRSIAVDP